MCINIKFSNILNLDNKYFIDINNRIKIKIINILFENLTSFEKNIIYIIKL